MHDIILTTLNARYSHTAFGLRYLWANLGPLQPRAAIREFVIGQEPAEIAEALLLERPRIIGIGVYIWNIEPIEKLVQILTSVSPETVIVLGGPEISYEYEDTALYRMAGYLVPGEGELAFRELAEAVLSGEPPRQKVFAGGRPELESLALPYTAYSDHDIAHRTLYVETSRGCPFKCEFCLSSLEPGVREFPLPPIFEALNALFARGARQFKFVDRTFNLREDRVLAMLDFLQARLCDEMQVHFEIVPDRLPVRVLERMTEFPPGVLRLEVGVQTFNLQTQDAISRVQDLDATLATLQFLRERTGALLHADLVLGMPHETWDSIRDGFDRLLAVRPQEIQVGILKRLKGAPIARHTKPHEMIYSTSPPYEILQTATLDFLQMQRLKRFARYFELYYNSGNFPASLPALWADQSSPFEAFMAFSDFL
ncbi:MAG TPA: radical SAM protein, partial [Candidatus Hydrogenedentes bacterium]|nr:radical SAM protein [Candidatus Hydrogenedentota bacterium]